MNGGILDLVLIIFTHNWIFSFLARPPHNEKSWEYMYENPSNPRGHGMRLGRPEMHVENDHGDTDAECIEDHGEQHKLAKQRNNQRRWWNDLCQQEEEDSERQKDGDGQA